MMIEGHKPEQNGDREQQVTDLRKQLADCERLLAVAQDRYGKEAAGMMSSSVGFDQREFDGSQREFHELQARKTALKAEIASLEGNQEGISRDGKHEMSAMNPEQAVMNKRAQLEAKIASIDTTLQDLNAQYSEEMKKGGILMNVNLQETSEISRLIGNYEKAKEAAQAELETLKA